MLTTFQAMHKLMGGMQMSAALSRDALRTAEAFASSRGISMQDLLYLLPNTQYSYVREQGYDTRGVSNPMIIGDYVFRTAGTRDRYLQARLRLPEDTPEELRDVDSVPTYEPDQNRSAMYSTIFQDSDR
jgi:hypothetical protein